MLRSSGLTRADRSDRARQGGAASLTGFAAPLHPLSQQLCESAVGEYAKGYLRLFLDRFGDHVVSASDGLVPLLERGLATRLQFDTAWDIAFANVRRAALASATIGPSEAVRVGAAAGLRMICGGMRGRFTVTLGEASAHRVDHWLISAADTVEAEGTADRVRLVFRRSAGKQTVLRRSQDGRWRGEGALALSTVPMDRNHCVLLPPEAWQALDGGEQFTPAEVSPSTVRSSLRRSIALLEAKSPRYLRWVDRVLRGVMPCKGSANQLRSGSDFNLPGIVQVSFPASAAAHAEMLVHECSHLYFQILARLGDVDDGSDETLYYSPVKQMGRRIDRILLAYHAFANVMLFYRDCLESGIDDDGYCERNAAATIPQLTQLDQALRTTKALTPLGRALYEPLAAALG